MAVSNLDRTIVNQPVIGGLYSALPGMLQNPIVLLGLGVLGIWVVLKMFSLI